MIKLVGDFWVDENENKWTTTTYTEKQAQEESESLVDCKGCLNCCFCTNCNDCVRCVDCTNCTRCQKSHLSENCVGCLECNNCEDCEDCVNCDNRKECNNCENCEECIRYQGYDCVVNCADCVELKNGKERFRTSEEDKPVSSSAAFLISAKLKEIENLLLEKNRKYGDSALNPCRIFSKADAVEQLRVRIDDKLKRLQNEQSDEDEDVVQDLIGYLVLLSIAKEKQKGK